jgi:hypothetical protein
MLFHRFGTLSHILASTELFDCGKDVDAINAESNVEKDGVRLIRKFQKLKNLDGMYFVVCSKESYSTGLL